MDNYVIIVSLKSKPFSKLINIIAGSRLLISSLPGSASITQVELLSKPRDLISSLEALPGKLDKKRHSPSILSLYRWSMHLLSHIYNVKPL